MGFDQIAAAIVKTGRTVEYKLEMLPGEPVIKVEHIGESNVSYLNDQMAQANSKLGMSTSGGKKKPQLTAKFIKERRDRWREIITKHAIRDLVAVHSDGKPATRDDIPEFVASLPDDVVDKIWDFVTEPDYFRENTIQSPARELAEK